MPGLEVGRASVSSSERMQWKIPDFFTTVKKLEQDKSMYLYSPDISFSGCSWGIVFDPEGPFKDGELVISLICGDKKITAEKTVTCYVGSERADFDEEHTSDVDESDPAVKYLVFTPTTGLDELKRRRSELVPSDTLTITFYVEGDDSDPRRRDIRRLMGLEDLSTSFEDLFVSKNNTDVTVKVKDKDFPVHKLVLIARSSVFSAMFRHDTSEEQTGVVTVPDCDPDSFQDFLHYLYTGKFDGVTSRNAQHLYVTSDKYDVQKLKSFCVDHMKQNLTVENVLDVIVLSDRYDESELLSRAQDFFNRNLSEVISTSRWKTLFREDFELANKLLEQMARVKSVK